MGKRILVADDSLTIQRAFTMVLAGSEFELGFAKSVETGLAALRKGTKPDLILADITLGTDSGYDFCSTVKADSSTRSIPVYILASEQTPYDENRGRRVGADGSLIKPFDSQALIDSLTQVCSAPAREFLDAIPSPLAGTGDTTEGSAKEAISSSTSDADDDYSEMVIERAPAPPPTSTWAARPAPRSASVPPITASPALPSQPPFGSPRPSLIPGARPSVPGNFGRPSAPSAPSVPVGADAKSSANRTIMGLPSVKSPSATPPSATSLPLPPTLPPVGTPAVGPAPVAPISKPPSTPPIPVAPPLRSSHPFSAPSLPAGIDLSQVTRRVQTPFPPTGSGAPIVSTAVDRTMEAISARGPEYAAIAKLSREVIEQVVWEVVPELAEVIIRQEIDRLVSTKK